MRVFTQFLRRRCSIFNWFAVDPRVVYWIGRHRRFCRKSSHFPNISHYNIPCNIYCRIEHNIHAYTHKCVCVYSHIDDDLSRIRWNCRGQQTRGVLTMRVLPTHTRACTLYVYKRVLFTSRACVSRDKNIVRDILL